jgi:hypothetical protein
MTGDIEAKVEEKGRPSEARLNNKGRPNEGELEEHAR